MTIWLSRWYQREANTQAYLWYQGFAGSRAQTTPGPPYYDFNYHHPCCSPGKLECTGVGIGCSIFSAVGNWIGEIQKGPHGAARGACCRLNGTQPRAVKKWGKCASDFQNTS